ncbi:hypothetical protein MHYP_G00279490 [Metynnis hypsauchen]
MTYSGVARSPSMIGCFVPGADDDSAHIKTKGRAQLLLFGGGEKGEPGLVLSFVYPYSESLLSWHARRFSVLVCVCDGGILVPVLCLRYQSVPHQLVLSSITGGVFAGRVQKLVCFSLMDVKLFRVAYCSNVVKLSRRGPFEWLLTILTDYSSETAGAGPNCLMSVLCDKAIVMREGLHQVVGRDRFHVNNLLDSKHKPRSICVILRDALSLAGLEMPYCVLRGNCEHFVTELRYGRAESRQIHYAVKIGVRTMAIGMKVLTNASNVARKKEKSLKIIPKL